MRMWNRMITTREIRRGEEARRRKGARDLFGAAFFILVSIFASACGANESILKSGKETPAQANVESGKTPFTREIDAMRTADFRFVYVLRRKDGGPIDSEDRGVIKVQTATANRRVAADDDKAFIIGSNVEIPPQNMTALFNRFVVENYSPPPAAAINTNANANK